MFLLLADNGRGPWLKQHPTKVCWKVKVFYKNINKEYGMRLYPGLSYMLKGIPNNTCGMEGYDCFEIMYIRNWTNPKIVFWGSGAVLFSDSRGSGSRCEGSCNSSFFQKEILEYVILWMKDQVDGPNTLYTLTSRVTLSRTCETSLSLPPPVAIFIYDPWPSWPMSHSSRQCDINDMKVYIVAMSINFSCIMYNLFYENVHSFYNIDQEYCFFFNKSDIKKGGSWMFVTKLVT